MRRVMGVVTVLAVAAMMIGCGGGGNYSSPKATAEAMHAAAKGGDKDAFMACFDKETRETFAEIEKLAKEGGKGKGVAEFTDKIGKSKVEFGEPKIDGDKATMSITMDGKKEKQPMQFVKEGGEWKVTIPELKMVLGMMKAMGPMMKGMGEAMKKGMGDAFKKMGEDMKKAIEKGKK